MMSEPKVVVVEGDSITERAMTAEELAQFEKDKAFNESFNAEIMPKEEAAQKAKQSILDKLGLTENEVKVLLG